MSLPALVAAATAGTAVAVVLAVLALAGYGCLRLCHDVACALRQRREQQTWQAAAEPEPAALVTEPDLHDPRCGTDDDLLRQVRAMWRLSLGGDR